MIDIALTILIVILTPFIGSLLFGFIGIHFVGVISFVLLKLSDSVIYRVGIVFLSIVNDSFFHVPFGSSLLVIITSYITSTLLHRIIPNDTILTRGLADSISFLFYILLFNGIVSFVLKKSIAILPSWEVFAGYIFASIVMSVLLNILVSIISGISGTNSKGIGVIR